MKETWRRLQVGASSSSQGKRNYTKAPNAVTDKEGEMKRNLGECTIGICEVIMPNETFNRHDLGSSIIRRPSTKMKVKCKL